MTLPSPAPDGATGAAGNRTAASVTPSATPGAPNPPAIPATSGLAIAAFGFGVLSFAASMIVHPPMPDRPAATILHWYFTHPRPVEVGELLMTLAVISLIWCLTEIRHGVETTGVASRTAAGMHALGLCGATLFITGTWAPLLLAVSADRGTEAPTPAAVHLLSDLSWFHYASQDLVTGAATACLAVLIWNRLLARRWVGWTAAISAALAVLGGAANFYPQRYGKLSGPTVLGFLGFLLLDVTMIAIGITSWRDRHPA